MDTMTPQEAQRIVAAYLKVVDAHAAAGTYPSSAADLPQGHETIRAAFKTCVTTLIGTGQLTPDLRDYLEVAYVSLADFVPPECVTLLREYGRAGEELATGTKVATERIATDAWRRLSEQSRLAGELARAISDDADRLRSEFRSWQNAAVAAS